MTDAVGLPIVILLVVGVPLTVSLFLGWIQFRRLTPLVFQCRRCGREFHQPPHHDFPRTCPRCHVADWNA